MRVTFDPVKRAKALAEGRPDFEDAGEVFAGLTFSAPDLRRNYGEARFVTAGLLRGRMVVIVWTPRGAARRIISMRKANEREIERYARILARFERGS